MRPLQHFSKSGKTLLESRAFQYLGSAFARIEQSMWSQSWTSTFVWNGFCQGGFFF